MSSASVALAGAERLSGTLGAAGDDLSNLDAFTRTEGETTLRVADVPVVTGHLRSQGYVDADPQGFALLNSADYAYRAAGPYRGALEARTDDITNNLAEHAESVLASVQGA